MRNEATIDFENLNEFTSSDVSNLKTEDGLVIQFK